jgi:hypothetical protein
MKAISLGFEIQPLKNAKVFLLRPPGHSNLKNIMNDALRDGFSMYTLGFSFIYTLLRAILSLFKRKILNFLILPLGYITAAILKTEKEDVAYTKVPSKIQYAKIKKYKNLIIKYIKILQ